ncbi:MAG: hypothetical protein K8S55_00395 [Phycisphaerae bacterium]|nr:hypothetical protein [Phycisphaerae bacterium]
MSLTHDELTDIDKLLGRMEKKARSWRIFRWILLGAGLLFAGQAVWMFNLLKTAISPEFSTRSFCIGYVLAIFLTGLGSWLLTVTLIAWNKGRNEGLLIKLAKSYVDEQRPIA